MLFFFLLLFYKMSNKESKPQVEQVENIPSDQRQDDNLSEKEYNKIHADKRNILSRIKDSIYKKPEKTQNAWHLLTNLNNTQRITFAAGNSFYFKNTVL